MTTDNTNKSTQNSPPACRRGAREGGVVLEGGARKMEGFLNAVWLTNARTDQLPEESEEPEE